MRKAGLGRGLDALLETVEADSGGGSLRYLPVDLLHRGRYQPRHQMDPEALSALAGSIRNQGIMQPIVVRPSGDNQYEIIAGERRWRAAVMAGLEQVPVLLREIPDEQALMLALVENIQREDLSCVDEALALRRLLDEFHLTHEAVAEQVGRSRAAVTNLLRLLQLPHGVQALLADKRISMGHARAILALPAAQQLTAAQRVADQGLSVRETERLVQALLQAPQHAIVKPVDPNVAALETELGDRLGTTVRIQQKGRAGQLLIRFASLEMLEGILAKIRD